MSEILPIRVLTDEDASLFGSLNIALAKLGRFGLPIGNGIVITPPEFKIKSILEHFDLGTKEVFSQSLTLVQKEINAIPIPQVLVQEVGKHKQFLLDGEKFGSIKSLWLKLLSFWLDQIKQRLWNKGFYPGITENLDPKVIIFTKKLEGLGSAFFDPMQDDVQILVKKGKLHPRDLKKITELVSLANKKLFIPNEYEWILDEGVKIVGVKQYTPSTVILNGAQRSEESLTNVGLEQVKRSFAVAHDDNKKSTVKVFFDLSSGFTIEKNIDGIYIDSGKIFDLNKPRESFEDLLFKLVESSITFPQSPVFLKLADKSEGMGKVRGTLRLLHQSSLLDPLTEAVLFARNKKGLNNIHMIVPFVRGVGELLQIKRELATKKLIRKSSLEVWMEMAVPENMINLEKYLEVGVDGVVLNLDEIIAYLNGFDPEEGELVFYKNEVDGLISFLEDGIRLLHKSKTPFIACGNLTLYPKVLEFLVEKGVYGLVTERYEAHSAKDLLSHVEKRIILKGNI